MIKFRNRLTGSIMWVTDDRAEEYEILGNKRVDDIPSEKPIRRTNENRTERRTSTRRNSNRDERGERW